MARKVPPLAKVLLALGAQRGCPGLAWVRARTGRRTYKRAWDEWPAHRCHDLIWFFEKLCRAHLITWALWDAVWTERDRWIDEDPSRIVVGIRAAVPWPVVRKALRRFVRERMGEG
jgi:hypothetical protein